MNTFTHSFLKCQSEVIASPADCEIDYDIVFLFSSWDARSVMLPKSIKKGSKSRIVLALWDQKDDLGLRDRHDSEILYALETIEIAPFVIRQSSTDLESVQNTLREQLVQAFARKGSPLKVLFDASASPRYYILDIFSFSFSSSLVKEIDFFYAEANYLPPNESDKSIIFTGDEWTLVPLPLIKNVEGDGSKISVLLSMGFEIEKTVKCIQRIDPHDVMIMYSGSGNNEQNIRKAIEYKQRLVSECGIPEARTFSAPASDVTAAWKSILEMQLSGVMEATHYWGICGGPKPHCLAMAAAAISSKKSSVYYIRPDQHKVFIAKPTGIYWIYKFQDLTAFV